MTRRYLIAFALLSASCFSIPAIATLPVVGQLDIPSDHRAHLELIGKRDALNHIAAAENYELRVSLSGSLWPPSDILMVVTNKQVSITVATHYPNADTPKQISFDAALAERIRQLVVQEFRRASVRVSRRDLILFDVETFVYTLEAGDLRCVATVDDIHDFDTRIGRFNNLIRMLAAYCNSASDERTGHLGFIDRMTTELEISHRYLAESARY